MCHETPKKRKKNAISTKSPISILKTYLNFLISFLGYGGNGFLICYILIIVTYEYYLHKNFDE